MNYRALMLAIAVPLAAAVFGNAFVTEVALTWYEALDHPPYKLPLWGSIIVALAVYVGYGVVIFRTFDKRLPSAVILSGAVVVGNEIWNIFFFGTRDLRLTFWMTVGFAVLVLVQTLHVKPKDRLSFGISFIYLMWVVFYDLPWLYQLSASSM